MADKQAMGARADLFAAHNSKQAHDVVAAVAAAPLLEQEGEDTMVAAVRPGAGSGQRGGGPDCKAAAGGARRSLDAVAADSRCPTLCRTRSRPGWRPGCVSTTTAFEPRPRYAGLPAHGWETKQPGVVQRRRRRADDTHAGSDIQQAFPSGHRCFLQHPSTSLFSTCHGPKTVWPGRSAHSLLGRLPGAVAIPGSGFFLEISIRRCTFPILGVDFLRAHKLLIDPEGHALLDSTGRRLAGQLRRSPPTATVVVGFVQPY